MFVAEQSDEGLDDRDGSEVLAVEVEYSEELEVGEDCDELVGKVDAEATLLVLQFYHQVLIRREMFAERLVDDHRNILIVFNPLVIFLVLVQIDLLSLTRQ